MRVNRRTWNGQSPEQQADRIADKVHSRFVANVNKHMRDAGMAFAQIRFDAKGNIKPMQIDAVEAARLRSQAAAEADARAQHPQTAATPGAPATPSVTKASTTATSVSLTLAPVKDAAAYGVYIDGKLVGHTKTPAFNANVGKTTSYVQFDSVDSSGRRSAATPMIRVQPTASGPQVSIATQSTNPPVAASS